MNYFKHPQSIVESNKIGEKTRIWAFAHILPKAVLGEECNICDHVFIENDVKIGNRVTIKSGVQLWDGIEVEDDVFIGPNATFTNDIFPRSKQYPEKFLRTILRQGCSIGANATILPGIEIGKKAMVGAGAVVTRNVPTNAIVVGNPAIIKGYVGITKSQSKSVSVTTSAETIGKRTCSVSGVEIYYLPLIPDLRGNLSFAEYGQYLPFIPKRYFIIFEVSSKEVRGEHAHHKLHQYLVCVKGSCAVVVDDGKNREEIVLDKPNIGLYLPSMTWGIQYKYSQEAVLLVLASDTYDPKDYIRDYDEFLKLKKSK